MSNARLNLQQLDNQADQVLVVGHLASVQADDGEFSAVALDALFSNLRVPQPSNTPHVLSVLQQRGHVMKVSRGSWAITPSGEAKLGDVGVDLSPSDLAIPKRPALGGAEHHTIPPELAPSGLHEPVRRFLERSAFTRNVFGITRFPDKKAEDHPLHEALNASRRVLDEFGLALHLASDKSVDDQLWPNIAGSMWACQYGLVILEDIGDSLTADDIDEDEQLPLLNSNVLIETGAMLMAGRRCVILRDSSVSKMPTDLVGHIYRRIDLADTSTVEDAVRKWCSDDLALQTPTK